jgi:membrane protein
MATAPWAIPWRGWKDILWRTYQKMNDDRLLAVAAGIVFFGVLALFPALTALVSLYGLISDPSKIDSQLSVLSGILPGGAVDILHEEIRRLTTTRGGGLSAGVVLGLLIALWSANSGTKAIIDALNVAYEEKETRSFVRLNLTSLAITLIVILAMIVAIAAVVAAPVVLNFVGLGQVSKVLISVLRWPLVIALVVIGLAALYRYAPNRREPRWQWVSVGGLAASVVWLVSSGLFSWYVASFGNYNATYGSLGAAMGMMMWMWISAIVILLGAQLNAEIEHQTTRDSTVDGDKPLGRRGAKMANTVGAAQR